MSNENRLPNRLIGNTVELKKISLKNDKARLEELLVLFKKNREHLLLWHHGWKELLFDNMKKIKMYIKENKLFWYGIYAAEKIIGCLEISHLLTNDKNLKFRRLSYWIDKDYTRKGIMYNVLSITEKMLSEKRLDFIMVEIDIDNKPSINLVQKLNYKLWSFAWLVSKNGKTMAQSETFRKILHEK
jgi:RimJ/RimL family protein N-acetyltransferase